MSYESVDQLQKALTRSVFHYAKDSKKAAGRALGTLVEVITFYLLKAWGLQRFLAIERRLPEYCNDEITHNVEYSLHPSTPVASLKFAAQDLPLSATKITRALRRAGTRISQYGLKSHQLLSRALVLRNACTIAEEEEAFLVATLTRLTNAEALVAVNRLFNLPFAIAECKRVGVEEGTRKGPQTIEKAKQGAYVARTVSALQKIRLANGEVGGVFATTDGNLICKKYDLFMREIVGSENKEFLKRFILTVGVVSNHGNWFTSDNHNKELKVLAQSYDWLLFLSDEGLAQFIKDFVLAPPKAYEPVRRAFIQSYKGKSGANQFTKVQMSYEADQVLEACFAAKLKTVESWFEVIAPRTRTVQELRQELHALAAKDWSTIHS